MTNLKMWMVRAGVRAYLIDDFDQESLVAIGWPEIGKVSPGTTRKQIAERMREKWPEAKPRTISSWANQVFRFLNRIDPGDLVVSYNPGSRTYLVGKVGKELLYDPKLLPSSPRIRKVQWFGKVNRDDLSGPTKNSLGSIVALFLVSREAAREILKRLDSPLQPIEGKPLETNEESDIGLEEAKSRSREFIKDKIAAFDGYELQGFVAGILRAMGYKTHVSPQGPDRGVDIFASPDGFGFEPPRILVEVKHRPRTAIGAPDIRSFLGGRHPMDKGLFVSTGGFSKDARYEADRANIPLMLMDMDRLVEAVLEHYENMDMETKAMLPLAKIYWPLDT